jgi:hypothetical protein
MRHRLLAAVVALSVACAEEVTDQPITGEWTATVNALGIGTMNLTLVEDAVTVTGTGQWTALTGGATRSVTSSGLHFESTLTMIFTFDTESGPVQFSTQGQVDSPTEFHLIFPVTDDPTRVNFRRR